MSVVNLDKLPPEAVGLRLYRFSPAGSDNVIPCEAMRFNDGYTAVNTVLRRAGISGLVQIGGDIKDHFADVLDDDANMIETVALDAKSYAALKNRWMRCKTEPKQ